MIVRTERHLSWIGLLGVLGWVLVVLVSFSRVRATIGTPGVGLDLKPLRDAGVAVRSGRPIYGVPMFVYMPPAALLGVLFSLFSFHSDVVAYAYLEFAILVSTVFLAQSTLGRSRWVPLGAALIAAALAEGDLVTRVSGLENVSTLLVLPCLGIIFCWGTGRWRSGAAILAATLLIKPMLISLLVVPLLARRWSAAALTIALTAGLFVLTLPILDGLGGVLKVADRVLRGSNLTGRMAVYNLSLWGWGQTNHAPTDLVVVARGLVVAVAVTCAAAVWVRGAPMRVATVGPLVGLLLGATLLAGPLSENHYLLVLLPAAFSCLVIPRPATRVLVVVAGLLAAYSFRYTTFLGTSPSALQTRFLVIELLVFAASALSVLQAGRPETLETRQVAASRA